MTYTITMEEKQYQDYLEYLTNATNIQDVKKPNKKEFGEYNTHPTIKPVKLMEWLVKLTTNEGDMVLDCFNGSGTTGVAATNLKRQYIGIDMEQKYLDITKQRIGETDVSYSLLHGECIEVMKTLPDGTFDAIITDPPYNVKMAGWDSWGTNKEFQEWITAWGKEAYRVLRPGGTIMAFASNRWSHYTAMGLDDAGFECRDHISWIFWAGMPKGKNLKNCREDIYYGWKPEKSLANLTVNIDACRIPVKSKPKRGDKTTEIVSVNNLAFEVDKSE